MKIKQNKNRTDRPLPEPKPKKKMEPNGKIVNKKIATTSSLAQQPCWRKRKKEKNKRICVCILISFRKEKKRIKKLRKGLPPPPRCTLCEDLRSFSPFAFWDQPASVSRREWVGTGVVVMCRR